MKNFDPTVVTAEPVPSPCVGVCTMHPQTGLCQGCYRTLNEIALWSTASESTKRAIWVTLLQRMHTQFE
jgi:predicted Fe-S protein YdhL (DUF1289 family)